MSTDNENTPSDTVPDDTSANVDTTSATDAVGTVSSNTENTSAYSSGATLTNVVGETTIQAATFQSMLTVLESLATHSHIFYDDYTTVCQCQCQCACSRGTV